MSHVEASMLMKLSLEKLLAEATTTKSTSATSKILIESCSQALKQLSPILVQLKKEQEQANASSASLLEGDLFWTPFRMALHPSQAIKVKIVALDAVQKLCAQGILTGQTKLTTTTPSTTTASTTAAKTVMETIATPSPSTLDLTELNETESISSPVKLSPHLTIDTLTVSPPNPIVSPHFLPPLPTPWPHLLLDDIIQTLCQCLPLMSDPPPPDAACLLLLKCLLTFTLLPQTTHTLHRRNLIQSIQCVYTFALGKGVVAMTAKACLIQMGSKIMERLNASSNAIHVDESESNDWERACHLVVQYDVYAYCKYLSRLSMKSRTGETVLASPSATSPIHASTPLTASFDVSPLILRGKSLALELLLSALSHPAAIANLVQQETLCHLILSQALIPTLYKNGLSLYPFLFEQSCALFQLSVMHYRAFLKPELDILFHDIYLRLLELGQSTQKQIIYDMLQQLAADASIWLDMYVNYDCEMEMMSVYEGLIRILVKRMEVEEESRLRAWKVIVTLLNSLYEYDMKQLQLQSAIIATPLNSSASTATNAIASTPPLTLTASNADSSNLTETVRRKQQFQAIIDRFNQGKCVNAIQIAKDSGFITDDESLVQFLKTAPLSKRSLGDYLGEGSAYAIHIMHLYMDSLSFQGMGFVDALRSLLQQFRLPGEAQKIDRIMEKFGNLYCQQNPSILSHADTAYTLAFSVIMLNTDQHSSQIKQRMDKAAFIKNNRGITPDGKDLPESLLSSIFDQVHEKELVMEEEASSRYLSKILKTTTGNPLQQIQQLNAHQQREYYQHEIGQIRMKSEAKRGTRKSSAFKQGTQHLTRPTPLVEGVLTYLIQALPFMLHDDLYSTLEQCMKMTESVTCHHLLYQSLIGKLKQWKEYVHVQEALMCLLIHWTLEWNEEWTDEHYYLFVDYLNQVSRPMSGVPSVAPSPSTSSSVPLAMASLLLSRTTANTNANPHTTNTNTFSNKLFESHQIILELDKLFSSTSQWNLIPFMGLMKALTRVCLEEWNIETESDSTNNSNSHSISNNANSNSFTLNKIIEIVYYNLNRIRLEWNQLWRECLQPFFLKLLLQRKKALLQEWALESLRQLSMKLLEREEMSHYHSQYDFMKLFEVITMNATSNELTLKMHVLDCLENIVALRKSHLKSGWKGILKCFTQYEDSNSLQRIWNMMEGLEPLSLYQSGVWLDYTECLASLGQHVAALPENDEQRNTLRQALLFKLRQGFSLTPQDLIEGDVLFYAIQFPLLSAMTRLLSLDVISVYFQCIETSTPTLEVQIITEKSCLMPLFEELEQQDSKRKSLLLQIFHAWLEWVMRRERSEEERLSSQSHSINAIHQVMKNMIFTCHDESLSQALLRSYQSLISYCPEPWLPFETFLTPFWKETLITEIFECVTESDLQVIPTASSLFPRFKYASVLQLALLEVMKQLMMESQLLTKLSHEQCMNLLSLIESSLLFAQRFNEHGELQQILWQAGFMPHKEKIILMQQQTHAMWLWLWSAFQLLERQEEQNTDLYEKVWQRIVPLMGSFVQQVQGHTSIHAKFTTTWSPVLLLVFQSFPYEKRHLHELFQWAVCLLAHSEQKELRETCQTFLERVATRFLKDSDINE